MRERGSSTARPTEKGGGGLPIRSRFGRFGRFRRVDSVDFGASIRSIRSISARRFGRFRRVDSCRLGRVAIRSRVLSISARRVAIRSIRSIRSISARRFRRVGSIRITEAAAEVKAQTQKKPDSSMGESGLGYRKVSRALNLPQAPLSNTRASARIVRSGLARRSCIVMITSGRRRIGRYTLQNMRIHGQS